jgi:hypothetical protein
LASSNSPFSTYTCKQTCFIMWPLLNRGWRKWLILPRR